MNNKHTNPLPISVRLPNGTTFDSTHTGMLRAGTAHTQLPPTALQSHLFPNIDHDLLSVGQLCDAGCTATFTKDHCSIDHDGTPILTGTRNSDTNRLWHIDSPSPQINQLSQFNTDRMLYAHAIFFSPVPATMLKALQRKYIHGIPGLNINTFKTNLPHTIATTKGHLDQVRQNKQSTKQTPPDPFLQLPPETQEDFQPTPTPDGVPSELCYTALWDTHSGKTFSDLTGRFIVPSSTGNNYVFLLYHYDSNSIHVRALPDRRGTTLLHAYKQIHDKLVRHGCRPLLHTLDNECSQALKDYLHTTETKFQLVPPGIHRRNNAERAIRTFKNHFIAGLCSTDPDFPLHLWDKLLPQAELTLNLLRGARTNPRLSAHEYLHGRYDFTATPMAPPGIKVIAHDKPGQRGTWSPHGHDGWYVGPALEHYRCYTIYNTDTKCTHTADTVDFFPPAHLTLPIPSKADLIHTTMADLTNILAHPLHQPLDPLTDSQLHQIAEFTRLLLTRSELPTLSKTKNEPAPSLNPTPQVRRVPLQTYSNSQRSTPAPSLPSSSLRRSPRLQAQTTANTATTQAQRLDPSTIDWVLTNLIPDNDQPTANKAINPDTGLPAEYPELIKSSDGHHWEEANCNEFGRLCQGYKNIKGTDTMHFISKTDIPKGRRPTYMRIVCADRPLKTETRRVRHTVGGDKIDYPFDVSTKTASLVTAKLIINSTISTPGARFMSMDIKDFFLNNDMHRYEYMRISLKVIPQAIIDQYHLQALADDQGFVYVEIRKGMYGLPQAGRIANDELVPYLASHGYKQSKRIAGLFRHHTRPISFCLIVDDFGIKYVGKEHAQHLESILRAKYTITTDWTGSQFCGLRLDWNYNDGYVDISMPGYVAAALQRFQHPTPTRPEDAPHAYNKPMYGRSQLTDAPDLTPPLTPSTQKLVQQIVGVFLYYGRAIDNTILKALNSIASSQAQGTEATMQACTRLLNYAATHPDAIVRFHASDMVLYIDADAAYLNEPKARSTAGAYFYLSDDPTKHSPTHKPTHNGPIHILCSQIGPVVASASEAETGAAFMAAQDGCPIRQTLIELGHPQPPTPLKTDNEVAHGILTDTVKQRRSKAIDMRFYWLQDRIKQNQYNLYWAPGSTNLGDYFTKHHSPTHHRQVRHLYLHDPQANTCIPVSLWEGVLKSSTTATSQTYDTDTQSTQASLPAAHPAFTV